MRPIRFPDGKLRPATSSPLAPRDRGARWERGFTLAEAIVVIVITGIIASVVAVFIQKPVQGYFDAVRRAELTDIADTALRRLGRDVRTALPNSVGVTYTAPAYTLTYQETVGGGRYRAAVTATGSGNPLDFTAADMSFDVIGPAPPASAAGYSIVVGNMGGVTGNSTSYAPPSGNTVNMGSILFPAESPGKRFYVVSATVTYVCDPAAGTLTRSGVTLATNVADCSITYASLGETRTGVVSIWLTLTRGGESVSLFHQVHVANTP